MEARFQHDFSRVRIHTDDQGAHTADRLGARAFTLAPHIVFSARARPRADDAGHLALLAHELAHVVQQSRGRGLANRGELEAEAHATAIRVARGADGQVRLGASNSVPLLEPAGALPTYVPPVHISPTGGGRETLYVSNLPVATIKTATPGEAVARVGTPRVRWIAQSMESVKARGIRPFQLRITIDYRNTVIGYSPLPHWQTVESTRIPAGRLVVNTRPNVRPEREAAKKKVSKKVEAEVNEAREKRRKEIQAQLEAEDISEEKAEELRRELAYLDLEPAPPAKDSKLQKFFRERYRQEVMKTFPDQPLVSFEEALKEGAARLRKAGFGNPFGYRLGLADVRDSYDARDWKEVEGSKIRVKKEPWLAMKNLVDNLGEDVPNAEGEPTTWRLECYSAAGLNYVYARWRTMTRSDFNREFAGLELGIDTKVDRRYWGKAVVSSKPGEAPHLRGETQTVKGQDDVSFELKRTPVGQWKAVLGDAPIGSKVRWSNLDAIRRCQEKTGGGAAAGQFTECLWANVNTIKVGPDQFSAHPVNRLTGVVSAQQLAEAMAKALNNGEVPEGYIKANIYLSGVEVLRDQPE